LLAAHPAGLTVAATGSRLVVLSPRHDIFMGTLAALGGDLTLPEGRQSTA